MRKIKKKRPCQDNALQTLDGSPLSRIVFGSWAMGGWYWGGADDSVSIRAVHSAIEGGINAFDTAPMYGFGRSEEVLGRALSGIRERVWIATKVGLRWDVDVPGENPFFETEEGESKRRVFRNLSAASIVEECHRSLRRLGTDYIDCLILHWPDPRTSADDILSACLRLREEGKVRFFGVSNFSVEEIVALRSQGNELPFCFDQERLNLLDRRALLGNIPYDRKNGIHFMAYSPLAQGLLSGRIGKERQLRDGDLRQNSPLMAMERREAIAERILELNDLMQRKGATMAMMAIAWVLHTPGVKLAVAGIRNEKQSRELSGVSGLHLRDDEYETIGRIFADQRYHGH